MGKKPLFKVGLLSFIGILAAWILYMSTVIPFFANAALQQASAQAKNGQCNNALQTIQNLSQNDTMKSFIANEEASIVSICFSQIPQSEKIQTFNDLIAKLQQATQERPYYTRSWISLTAITNLFITQASDDQEKTFLVRRAEEYIQKAASLSPRHSEIYAEWTKTYLFSDQFDKAAKKARECLQQDITNKECWWLLARAEISQGNDDIGQEALQMAQQHGYSLHSEQSLIQLAESYDTAKNLKGVLQAYEELVFRYSDSSPSTYNAALAFVYRQMGRYSKAKEQALFVFAAQPQNVKAVQDFLDTLPPNYQIAISSLLTNVNSAKEQVQKNPNDAQFRLNLAQAYRDIGQYSKANVEARQAAKLEPSLQQIVQNFMKTYPIQD